MSDFDVSLTPAAAINVSIAGGVGPQGPAGAGGVVSLNGATGALTLAAVGGSWAVAGTTITLTVSAGASTWSALTGKPFSSIGTGLSVDGSGVLSATGLTSVSWGDITGKPATFAPSAHTHVIADTTGLQAALDAKQASGSYAAAVHTHTVADVPGLGTLATQSGTFSGTSSGTNTGDQTITLTGDVTGSGTGSFAATLSGSGVSAGTYASVTVDAKGRVTAGTATQAWSTITGTPTTLAGYGITDAAASSHASTHQTGGADAVASVVVTPSSLTADVNDWAIGTGDIFRVAGTAARAITGIAAGTSGLTILLVNVGTFALTLKHQSASSTAANRFTVPWAGDCVLAASGGAIVLVYDATSSTWRVV
jgi:phage-related tail fiber protein